jgi:beta-xylosidase
MGQAKRRKQSDPTYGQPVKIQTWVEPSKLTGKWLVMAKVEEYWQGCVSPHFKREDAIAACDVVEREFAKVSRAEWSKSSGWIKACSALIGLIEDDDEVLAVVTPTDKGLVLDTRPTSRRPLNAWLLEQSQLSKAVADSIDWVS